jgi:hypothetical protein
VPRVLIHPTKEPKLIWKDDGQVEQSHSWVPETMRPVPLEEELLRRVLLAENFFEQHDTCFPGFRYDMILTVPERLDFAAEEDPIESCYLALAEGLWGERSTD